MFELINRGIYCKKCGKPILVTEDENYYIEDGLYIDLECEECGYSFNTKDIL